MLYTYCFSITRNTDYIFYLNVNSFNLFFSRLRGFLHSLPLRFSDASFPKTSLVPISSPTPIHSSGIVDTPYFKIVISKLLMIKCSPFLLFIFDILPFGKLYSLSTAAPLLKYISFNESNSLTKILLELYVERPN